MSLPPKTRASHNSGTFSARSATRVLGAAAVSPHNAPLTIYLQHVVREAIPPRQRQLPVLLGKVRPYDQMHSFVQTVANICPIAAVDLTNPPRTPPPTALTAEPTTTVLPVVNPTTPPTPSPRTLSRRLLPRDPAPCCWRRHLPRHPAHTMAPSRSPPSPHSVR